MAQARTGGDRPAGGWLPRAVTAVTFGVAAWAFLAVVPAEYAGAVSASPRPFEIEQPDGTTFRARLYGDERAHGVETTSGYTVVQNRRGAWEYAARAAGGRLRASGRVVGPDGPGGLPRHLRSDEPTREESPLPAPISEADSEPTMSTLSPQSLEFAVDEPAPVVHHNLVLLASFIDQPPVAPAVEWSGLFFGPSGSLRHYYNEVSYGQFGIQPAAESYGVSGDGVVGWLALDMNHPAGDADAERRVVQKAIEAADASVNFANYDTDRNGHLTPDELHVTVVAAGYEGAYPRPAGTKAVWGHRWALFGTVAAPTVDGVTVANGYRGGGYTEFGERHNDHQATLGIVAHEFGHDIGWPDLYDTDDDSAGAGNWSVMATGSWGKTADQYHGESPSHPDAWSKYFQGWTMPTPVAGTVAAASIASAASPTNIGVAFRLGDNPGGAADWSRKATGSGEYFLIENRQRVEGTYDAALPGTGLLIWHINEANGDNDNNVDRLVALEQADGLNELNISPSPNRGDAADPYPGASGNTAFGAKATPSSAWADGTSSGLSVAKIGDSAAQMTADLVGVDSADLAVSQTGTAEFATVTFDVAVDNNGPTGADSVVLTEALPPGLTPVSAVASNGTCDVSLVVSCQLGDLASDGQVTVRIVATATATGEVGATAAVSSLSPDPQAGNNSAPALVTVERLTPPIADLRVSVTPQKPRPSRHFSYVVEIRNDGDAATADSSVTVALPAAAALKSVSNAVCAGSTAVHCSTGPLNAGQSKKFSVAVVPAAAKNLPATATAATTSPETDTSDNIATGTATVSLICDNDATSGADRVVGSSASEVLCGLGGSDTLIGKGGNDLLFGGAGSDTIDYVASPLAVSVSLTKQGPGTVGARPRDRSSNGHGKDTLFSIERAKGSPYGDAMTGRDGASDRLWGLGGGDVLRGLSAADKLFGGDGRDTLYGGNGADRLNGGGGSDYCRQRSDTLTSCER